MDSEQVGYWLIIGIIVFTAFGIRNQVYAVYLEEGMKFFFTFMFLPFAAFFKLRRAMKDAREEWAEEIIERHKNARKIDADS
tara:strand:+ start:1471 stop:1716 length:246 start_codon:yes stop_codon:yes gene_type:complete